PEEGKWVQSREVKDITGAGKTGWEEGGKAADKAASDAAARQAESKADTTKNVEQGTTTTTPSDAQGEVKKADQADEDSSDSE
ncbi:MAG TPA: hypothetical protein PKM25_18830, partial [Candidatus Ozemobacteraceae bacterium]|nr:hypothetical protein [Candidatus Ozemobacteraceae bacterium]